MAKGDIRDFIKSGLENSVVKKDNSNTTPSDKSSKAADKAFNKYLKLLEKNEEYLQKKRLKDAERSTKITLDMQLAAAKEQAKYGFSFGDKLIGSVKTAGLSLVKGAVNGALKGITDALQKTTKQVEDYLQRYSTYTSAWNTRLQGLDKNYTTISKIIDSAVGTNKYIQQSKVFEKLNTYIGEGMAYNVEQRAFLGELSAKIANTFDAMDKSLVQLVRIQQADSTAARLGMESMLTQFLNSRYLDTSYLSGTSDSISAAILGANSQLSRDGSLAFEYAVQKWLGSMYSVGVSDSTVQMLAQGINALGTGDITSLSGNTALQNLFALAAGNAGLDYSQLLTGGMNANTTNQLMKGVVTYLQQVANSQNQVVKAQYANILGVSVADLTSVLNLAADDIKEIYDSSLTFNSALEHLNGQLDQLSKRTSTQEMIENVFDNVMTSVGTGIATNAASYATWLIADLVDKATGGLLTMDLHFMGLGTTVNLAQTVKTGIVGIGLLGKIPAILSQFSKNAGFSLDNSAWGATETTFENRGRGLSTTLSDLNSGIGSTTSQMAYIGNIDESDTYKSSLQSAEKQKESVMGSDDKSEDLEAVLKDQIAVDVSAILDELRSMNARLTLFGSASSGDFSDLYKLGI